MKQGDIFDKKEVELGGRKFNIFLLVCKSDFGDGLYLSARISPVEKHKVRGNPFANYPELNKKEENKNERKN